LSVWMRRSPRWRTRKDKPASRKCRPSVSK
jgi:hypothetical protein